MSDELHCFLSCGCLLVSPESWTVSLVIPSVSVLYIEVVDNIDRTSIARDLLVMSNEVVA